HLTPRCSWVSCDGRSDRRRPCEDGRLPLERGRMSRIPVKLRVTLVFAAVMAIVLAATGLFLYLRLQSSLNRSIDQDLQSRSQQLIKEMRVADTPLAEAARSLLRNDNR